MEELARPRVEREIDRQLADLEGRFSEGFIEEQRQKIPEAVRKKWAVTVIASRPEFSTRYTGYYRDVLKEIDPRSITDLILRCPSESLSSNEIEVRFSKKRGCTFAVRGQDPEWVRAVYSTLLDELRRDIPWWNRMRSWIFAAPVAVLTALAASTALLRSDFLIWWIGFSFGGYALALLLYFGMRTLFPGFEIMVPESKGRGGRALAVLGAFLLNVVASVVATFLRN
jgi:hypothetical protein